MKCLAVLGASGHGKVVAEAAVLCGWSNIEFYDDAWPELERNGVWPVVGDGAKFMNSIDAYQGVFVAIGNNSVRAVKVQRLLDESAPLVTIQHPAAIVSSYAQLGAGSVVMGGAVVNVDTVIGKGAIINTGATVDHDCALGDFVHVSPGANLAGGVVVGNRSWIGIGASVKQQMTVGSDVIVGAGAAVINDVPNGSVVIGVPAKPRS